jgi:Phage Tail Collar Domain
VAFAGDNVPDGWDLCDGRSVSKDDPKYQRLFEAIGAVHGGDANPRFQLPDYRGLFLRGVDGGAGRDPGRELRAPPGEGNTGNGGNRVGSVQDHALGSHVHATPGRHLEAKGGGGFEGSGFDSNSNQSHPMSRDYESRAAGGEETRPKNAYVNYIIKLLSKSERWAGQPRPGVRGQSG